MKLQEIAANIRLRGTWEAIDMGFSMVQTWWKAIYIPLAILTFFIAAILFFIIPEDYFWVTGLIFWWLKPLYDRLVLHIISHKLFNEELTSWQALKAIPSLIWNTGFFQTMTFRRLSMSRGFNLPIWQLEKLRGKQRSERQRVLHMAAHSQAIWLTIALIHIEMILTISLFALIALFMPEHILEKFFRDLLSFSSDYDDGWLDYINYIFYVLVITFIHPFYIAGNFSLYINRRTQLEAWDIELDFKKMAIRLKNLSKSSSASLIIYALLFSITICATPNSAIAEDLSATSRSTHNNKTEFIADSRQVAESSKKIIEEVMLTENLDDKVVTQHWVKKKRNNKKNEFDAKIIDSSFANFMNEIFRSIALFVSKIIEFGLWIIIAIAIILLFYHRKKWLHLLQNRKKTDDKYEAPEIMFGMDVRKESLPKDIIEESKKQWQKGQHREALSLLYRGALIRLINQENIRLKNSYTEGDVLRSANKQLTTSKQNYLKLLTTQWKLIAYAHRSPEESDMQKLFTHWSSEFAINTNNTRANNTVAVEELI